MDKFDKVMEGRSAHDESIQDLLNNEYSLIKSLKDLNDALDNESDDLSELSHTVQANRTKMLSRFQENETGLVDEQETVFVVNKEEGRSSSYRIVANESRALKKRITEDRDEKIELQQTVAVFSQTKQDMKIRCKNVVHEERAFWMRISVKVQWIAVSKHWLEVHNNKVSGTNLTFLSGWSLQIEATY